ncbi:MAG: type IV conjugative transfer system protein TraL [Gammaproteobacteria bacterium]
MNVLRLPRHVDDPPQLLLWSADELVPVALGLVIGILVDRLLLLVALGLLTAYFYRRFKDQRPDGYLLHALYWHGLLPLRGRGAVNPFRRVFYP